MKFYKKEERKKEDPFKEFINRDIKPKELDPDISYTYFTLYT